MDQGFCGMPFPKNEFLGIFRWLDKPNDQISFLTTNKELYQRIPRLEIDKCIAFGYLCNNYAGLSDEEFISPSLLKSLPINVVELRCGDHSFPLQIQFLVFTRFFRLGHLQSPLKLLIDSKRSLNDGELDALLKTMDARDPILDAIKELKLFFLRMNDRLELVCDHLPNLECFCIKPIENLKTEGDVYKRYSTLFSKANLSFRCDMNLYYQSSPEEYEKNGANVNSFMDSTFSADSVNHPFLFRKEKKEHIFGFLPR